MANDGKMTSHMQVNRADVETDAGRIRLRDEARPNYGLPIYVKGEARVEIPAYAAQHVDAWVYNADGKWQSDVKGLWSPSFGSSALTGFSVADIDLESAFTIVKKDTQGVWVPVSDDEIAAQKLVSLTRFPRRLPPTTASRSPVTNSRITAATNPCPSSVRFRSTASSSATPSRP